METIHAADIAEIEKTKENSWQCGKDYLTADRTQKYMKLRGIQMPHDYKKSRNMIDLWKKVILTSQHSELLLVLIC